MVDEPGKQGPSAKADPDYVDLEWATAFLRRLARRLFPDGALDPAQNGEQRDAGVATPTPGGRTTFQEVESETASSAVDTAIDVPPGSDAATDAGRRQRLVLRSDALPLTIAVFVGVIATINHFSGHDWGDDFALYMRQAKALTIGNIGEVISDNRFTVDNSGWNTFSPYSYPWGWPLLVAPFYAVVGLNYEVFKLLEVAALCIFLLAFFAIVKRRAGSLPATVLTLLIGLSPLYIGGTDTVLSDIPYLCFVGVSLWWMDRCRLKGIFSAGTRHLVILGLLLAYTYNVRREGIILLLALAALHVVTVAGMVVRTGSSRLMGQAERKALLLPYGTFLGAVVTFHLLLPTVLLPRAPGAGLQNVSTRITYYRDALAEQIGLRDPGSPMELFGSEEAAENALLLLIGLAAIGVVGRLILALEEDVTFATYLCGTAFLLLVSPYQEGRYLYSVTPLVAYFAYQALPAMAKLGGRRSDGRLRLASGAAVLALVGLVALNARDLARSTRYHLDYHYTVHGPESADAQEMFQAVRNLTRTDDVILFFRSRAMTLYSDRRAVMGSNLQLLLPRSDWYVMAKNSTYVQTLLTDEQAAAYGLTKRWENVGWVIWRVPPHVS